MKKISTVLVVVLSLFFSLPIHSEYKARSYQNLNNSNIAYTIYIPGKKVADGWQPAKIYNIPYVGSEDYLHNAIHIKTKTRISFDKNTNAIYSSTLMVDLNELGIVKVRAPFTKTGDDTPLNTEPYGIDRILEIYFDSGMNPYDVCRKLMDNPEVEYASPVFVYHTNYTPNDPSISKQWFIKNIKMKEAWDISKGSEDVVIGIVDSGTDWKHVDLADNIWTNPNEIPGNGIDDDHNGKIDDIRGWDLVGNVSASQINMGQWKEDNDPTNPGTTMDNKHGTHVGGCSSAATDNKIGIAGTGFKTKIMPVKCATDQNIRGIYRGYEGITYAANNGADVINCSWSGPGYSPVGQDIINNAVAKGAVVVVAAGNDGHTIDNGSNFPAAYENVVCVGATRSNNRKAGFSNWGLLTTVYAPGQSIYSTMPKNTYANESGTSMASPITAGVAALIKAVHSDWTPKQIYHQLRSTCDNVVNTNPDLRPYYYGRINAYNALNYNHQGGPNIPGIEISNIVIGKGEALTNYDPVIVILDVSNFLASASNVVLNIAPQNNYIGVNTKTINVGTLGQMQTKKVSLALQLLTNNPWYVGYANIIVTIKATGYTNYQLVKIPVKIQSNNKYTILGTLPEIYIPQWMSAVAPKRDVVWAVGYGGLFGNNGGFFKAVGSSTTGKGISSEYAFCIDAIDENTAWVGTNKTNGTSANIRKTVNGGGNWSAVSVSTITGFINTIHFYNEQKGVFLGDQKNNKWGIGLTSNSGQSWKQPSIMPPPLKDEQGLAGCGAYVGSSIWFGTNKGRVIVSRDEGKTWNATQIPNAGQVWLVAIMDDKNGLAVYSDTGSTNKLLATTTNGGYSWNKNKYDFSKNLLNPVYFYTNPKAGSIYMLCSGGEIYSTKDNGTTWKPVLSMFHGSTTIGAASDIPISKMQMWDIGTTSGKLEFSYMPVDVVKKIELVSADSIDFDSVLVDKFRLRAASLQNNGNVPIQITPEIIPDAGVGPNEFTINAFNNDIVDPGNTISVRVKFVPQEVGLRTAVLKINADADPSEIFVHLKGIGKEQIIESVINELPDNIIVAPNPSNNFINIKLNNWKFDNILMIDVNGRLVKTFALHNNSQLDISSVNTGIYYLIFQSQKKSFYKKIIISR